jgi:threonine/homoserine/homoserine lactone efflux protein
MFDLTLPLLLFLFPLAYSPGPGNSFFAALGARAGFAGTLPASLGYHAATALVTLAVGLGFAGLSDMVLVGLRYAGAAWVFWIAWRMWSAPPARAGSAARVAGFWDGLALLVLNPKAWLIIGLMFSQFLPNGGGVAQVIWITTIFTLNNFVAFALWTLAGAGLGRTFASDRQGVWLNRMFALTLAGVGIWMIGR